MSDFVYHGSIEKGLPHIAPRLSSHGESYVYATPDRNIALFFIRHRENNYGDFSFALARSRQSGLPFICERYPNAFTEAFHERTGSLYKLAARDFTMGTGWQEEVVTPKQQAIVEEIDIDDTSQHLWQAAKDRKIEIYIYPTRPPSIPNDDADLIDRAVTGITVGGLKCWTFIKRYYPHLCTSVINIFDQRNLYATLPDCWCKRYTAPECAANIELFRKEGLRIKRGVLPRALLP